MQPVTQTHPVSKKLLWTGYIMSALPMLMLISVSTASYLRTSLLILCVASLLYLLLKHLCGLGFANKAGSASKIHLPASLTDDPALREYR